MKTLEHLRGNAIAGPTRNCGAKIDLSPLGMTGRDQELSHLENSRSDEAFDAAVPVAALRPVEYGKNRRHRDGLDFLAFGDQRGIIFRVQTHPGCNSLRRFS